DDADSADSERDQHLALQRQCPWLHPYPEPELFRSEALYSQLLGLPPGVSFPTTAHHHGRPCNQFSALEGGVYPKVRYDPIKSGTASHEDVTTKGSLSVPRHQDAHIVVSGCDQNLGMTPS